MNPLIGFGGFDSPIHWILLIGIGVLLFGKRLPEVGRSLGKGLRDFKSALSTDDDSDERRDELTSQTPAQPTQPAPVQPVAAAPPAAPAESAAPAQPAASAEPAAPAQPAASAETAETAETAEPAETPEHVH